jgi:hypothetical protein
VGVLLGLGLGVLVLTGLFDDDAPDASRTQAEARPAVAAAAPEGEVEPSSPAREYKQFVVRIPSKQRIRRRRLRRVRRRARRRSARVNVDALLTAGVKRSKRARTRRRRTMLAAQVDADALLAAGRRRAHRRSHRLRVKPGPRPLIPRWAR